MEAATRDTQLLKSSSSGTNPINQVRGKAANGKGRTIVNSKSCYCCGKTGHAPAQCRFKDATYHKSQKKGHIATVCRSKASDKKSSSKLKDDINNWMDLKALQDSDDDLTFPHSDLLLPMNKVSKSSVHPMTVELEINSKKLIMEI